MPIHQLRAPGGPATTLGKGAHAISDWPLRIPTEAQVCGQLPNFWPIVWILCCVGEEEGRALVEIKGLKR